MDAPKSNVLFYGDNLDILRRYIGSETVDLVYLDPPFNSTIRELLDERRKPNLPPFVMTTYKEAQPYVTSQGEQTELFGKAG